MSIMLEKIIQESAEDKITISHNIHKKKSSTICIFQNNSLPLHPNLYAHVRTLYY